MDLRRVNEVIGREAHDPYPRHQTNGMIEYARAVKMSYKHVQNLARSTDLGVIRQ